MAPPLHVRQVAAKLHEEFDGLIDTSDKQNAGSSDREMAFLTRALAARALMIDAPGCVPAVASASIVDGTGDNGLDAVYVDETNESPVLYIVQSKWHQSGAGSISAGDCLKFLAGIKDLTNCRFDRFNERVAGMAPLIEGVLDKPNLQIRLLIASSGAHVIDASVGARIADILEEFNQLSEVMSFKHLTLSDFYKSILGGLDPGVAELEVLLREWGRVTEPFEAYTGLVSVQEVAAWYAAHGDRLFTQNIRKSLGNTAVNNSITETLRQNSDHFWYFNNGITALCESIDKTAKGGGSREAGTFVTRGVSIVNGAQTVASIARAVSDLGDAAAELSTSVTVRFISLANCPPDFATDVTRATNTQNTVEAQDFVALDPEQVRLRQELALMLQKVYSIKRGEDESGSRAGCNVNEATIALACLDSDPTLAVLAKSAIGRLYASISRPPYRKLFNSATSAHRLWRAVEVMRAVDRQLMVRREQLDGRDYAVALQGNRIVLHLVGRRLPLDQIGAPDFDWSDELARIPEITDEVLDQLIDHVEAEYSGNYITSLFKNSTRCSDIVAELAG